MRKQRLLMLALVTFCCIVGASSSGASNPARGADIEGVVEKVEAGARTAVALAEEP